MKKAGSAPIARRAQAAIARRRRLAVGAGDGEQPLLRAELGQQLAAGEDRERRARGPAASSGLSSPIAVETTTSASGGQVGRVVADRRLEPGPAQPLHIRGVGAVAAGDASRPSRGADQRQAAHPGAADADEVQPRPAQSLALSQLSRSVALTPAAARTSSAIAPGGVGLGQRGRGDRHRRQPGRVAEQGADLGGEARGAHRLVLDHHRRARLRHPGGVGALVVGGRVRVGDEDRRPARRGHLEDRAARAAQDQVAGGEAVAEVGLVLEQRVGVVVRARRRAAAASSAKSRRPARWTTWKSRPSRSAAPRSRSG